MKALRNLTLVLLACTLVFVSACGKSGVAEQTPSAKTEKPSDISQEGQEPSANGDAADPFGKYEQPVTITIGKEILPDDKSLPSGDSVENNQYTRLIEDKINVKVKAAWIASVGDAYTQKVGLSISSNDLPDAMVVTEADFRKLSKLGLLEDLTDVYNTYASPKLRATHDSTKGMALESATYGGKLLAIPNVFTQVESSYIMWLRQDWLDKLKLEPPKTVDDLQKIAKAFIDQDPGGNGPGKTIGFTGAMVEGNVADFQSIFAAFHAYPNLWYKDASGQLKYGSITPEAKQALEKLREMYAAGVLDKEFALRKDFNEPAVSGKTGIFFQKWWAPMWPLNDSIQNNPKADWQAYAVPLDSEGKYNTRLLPASTQFVVVKKGVKNPEAIIKLLNVEAEYAVDPELDPNVNPAYWPLRVVFAEADIVEQEYKTMKKLVDGEIKPEDMEEKFKPFYENYLKYKENPTADIGAWSSVTAYMSGVASLTGPKETVPTAFSGTTKTMELKWPSLIKRELEVYNKIIMGVEPLDSFDTFVEEWKRTGGDEIMKEIEAELQS
ncbi:extracellular solute-binding protein [Paenibacillus eucommiae]|uniref:Aldouronate transport system substrate-binding protein n=1 Tax=Paenibacillus eucommiae TaxID=1355755 RepID=A0ABS4IUR6_9BACL|nr:extracellular solute-binding protein [Paenibacillus eucommiae]MBP1990314.1 putative aldouronate transport system substrate-binding protein [Paenibacillus eucommiae]